MHGGAERLASRQAVGEPCEGGVRLAPLDLRQRVVEVAQRIAGGDVGEGIAAAVAILAGSEVLLHDRETAIHLGALPLEPRRRALLLGRLPVLVVDQHRCIRDAVSERLPALDLDALVPAIGYEPGT